MNSMPFLIPLIPPALKLQRAILLILSREQTAGRSYCKQAAIITTVLRASPSSSTPAW